MRINTYKIFGSGRHYVTNQANSIENMRQTIHLQTRHFTQDTIKGAYTHFRSTSRRSPCFRLGISSRRRHRRCEKVARMPLRRASNINTEYKYVKYCIRAKSCFASSNMEGASRARGGNAVWWLVECTREISLLICLCELLKTANVPDECKVIR